MRTKRSFLLGLAAALGALLVAGGAVAHPDQHGTIDGHLIGSGAWGKLALVGKADVTNIDDLIADVGVDPRGNYAYLANWGRPDCAANSEAGGVNNPDAGVYVVEISDPANPRQVGFIAHSQDSRPGEGVQAVEISTKFFNGVMLVTNNEQCGKNGKGGVSLYDVSNPLSPSKLSEHFGDRGFADTNDIHSAWAWDAGDNAYVVIVDNFETTDVDILDITNPKRPRLVAEYNLNTLARQQLRARLDQQELGLQESSLHDMVVKKIGDSFVMLLSYWDGGYVQLDVTNPAAARIVAETDFTNPDPELLESAGIALPPEGNAHQAEFTADNRFFIGTDEDFSPYRATFRIETGPNAGLYPAGEFGWTPSISTLADGRLNGPTVYGGYGCDESAAEIPQATDVFPTVAAGEERILVLERGPVGDPSVSYAACFFSTKVENGQDAGYDAVIIANHHSGAGGGDAPDAYICGGQGHDFDERIPALCLGHRAFHLLFGATATYTYPEADPAIGERGEKVSATPEFDGWGYVHLYSRTEDGDPSKPGIQPRELDTYAIDEAHDEAFSFGFGDLTVHEVATHPTNAKLAFLSYYSGGMRALKIEDNELVEIGGYLDPQGNDFWGVEVYVGADGKTYVLGSDRDSGLWIFQYTGR